MSTRNFKFFKIVFGRTCFPRRSGQKHQKNPVSEPAPHPAHLAFCHAEGQPDVHAHHALRLAQLHLLALGQLPQRAGIQALQPCLLYTSMVAVFCGAANTLVPSLLLAYELFGGAGLELIALGCGLSYMLSGYHGLYLSLIHI